MTTDVQPVVVCLAEGDVEGIAEESVRAVGFSRSLGAVMGGARVLVVVFGADGGAAAGQLASAGYGGGIEVLAVSSLAVRGYAPAAWARALAQLVTAAEAVAVVAAATDRGNEVLAHLGAMTGLPVAVNCVSAQPASAGSWRLVRQRWAGSLLEDAVLDATCALLTVAAEAGTGDAVATDSVTESEPAESAWPPVRMFEPELTSDDLRVRATESAEDGGGVSLATARVVVGGGRGVGGPDGFGPLEELAELLGGVVGVSRVVTSQGWRPHRQQVGQTGTKIAPELYLACGISGAIQHMAGCLSARHIIVINTDPDAPIISHADHAVIGDLNEVVPALVAALKVAARQG